MLVDNVSDAIISTGVESRIVSWNKAAEKTYGWKQEEVLGKRIRDILKVEFTDTNFRDFLKQLDETGYWEGESLQKRKDGSTLNISGSISRIKDSSGKAIGNVAIYRDITERKKAQDALKQLNAFNNGILENAPNPIMVQNPDASIRYVNPAFEQLTGFTATEIINTRPPLPPLA